MDCTFCRAAGFADQAAYDVHLDGAHKRVGGVVDPSTVPTPPALAEAQLERVGSIDGTTADLIALGFTFDLRQFSLSSSAQKNWLGIHAFSALMAWPVRISDMSDVSYLLAEADLIGFMAAGLATKQAHLDSGAALRDLVMAATTVAEVWAVEDLR